MANKKVYLLGIGGIAMGNLAGALQDAGYEVTGSDSAIYPPMSDFLRRRNITVKIPFSVSNIKGESPELVIIGNVIRAQNPEAMYVIKSGIEYLSMADAVKKLLLERKKTVVVSGTHGKSTTSSLLAWIFQQAGHDPTVFIGALLNEWNCGYRIGNGEFAIIEGDEYDTAFFDKTPKFLHYNPFAVIITGIEFDHADIYPNLGAIRSEFEKLVTLIPEDGLLVIRRDDPYCEYLMRKCKARVVTYGLGNEAEWKLADFVPHMKGALCTFSGPEGRIVRIKTPTIGRHNALNCLASVALVWGLELSVDDFIPHFETFPGLWRRQSVILNSGNIVVIDDFAHHPTAVMQTIKAVKEHHVDKKVVAIFEPRTNTSKRKFFQNHYSVAFDRADLVVLKTPPGFDKMPEDERLDLEKLARDISERGVSSYWFSTAAEVLDFLISHLDDYGIFLFMSNGPMDGLPNVFAENLRRWNSE